MRKQKSHSRVVATLAIALVKTFFHPGAHVYPPWAPAEIVKFFQNHKRP
jgi:hypothetical protein